MLNYCFEDDGLEIIIFLIMLLYINLYLFGAS